LIGIRSHVSSIKSLSRLIGISPGQGDADGHEGLDPTVRDAIPHFTLMIDKVRVTATRMAQD